MDDYSDFIPAPELFDHNRDGVLDSDELLYFYLCEEYADEEFSKSSDRIRCGDLLLFGGLLLFLNLFFDAIFGGSSRVGKKMRSGGYRSRSRSSGGGGGFLAGLIVGGLCLLMSHPRANKQSCRRSMFRKQPVPPCYSATRRAMKQERKQKTSSAKSSSAGSVPKASKSRPKGNPSGTPTTAQQGKNTASSKSTPPSASVQTQPQKVKKAPNTERRPAAVSGSSAWRDACEDGSPYGLDPRNYATEEQYIDALNTAKFAAQFHKKKQE